MAVVHHSDPERKKLQYGNRPPSPPTQVPSSHTIVIFPPQHTYLGGAQYGAHVAPHRGPFACLCASPGPIERPTEGQVTKPTSLPSTCDRPGARVRAHHGPGGQRRLGHGGYWFIHVPLILVVVAVCVCCVLWKGDSLHSCVHGWMNGYVRSCIHSPTNT